MCKFIREMQNELKNGIRKRNKRISEYEALIKKEQEQIFIMQRILKELNNEERNKSNSII